MTRNLGSTYGLLKVLEVGKDLLVVGELAK